MTNVTYQRVKQVLSSNMHLFFSGKRRFLGQGIADFEDKTYPISRNMTGRGLNYDHYYLRKRPFHNRLFRLK